jgi:peptidoglycan/LPS O-acetylase OafA/YrhL
VGTAGGIRMRRFYGARARRLLPASALVGVVTLIASAVLLPPLRARAVINDGVASALYFGNYRFANQGIDYLAADTPPSPFQHYWSLGVEEQFYLVWPLLIIATVWIIRRVRRRRGATATAAGPRPYIVVLALVVAISFAASLMATSLGPSLAFFSLPTRAWELAAGGLVALTAVQWRRLPPVAAAIVGWAGLALVLLACHLLDGATAYPGTAALLPVLGAALVIGAGCAGATQGCGRALALPPMQAIGRVSYSWYLWHWPLLLLVPPLLGHPLGLSGKLVTITASLGLAVLTLRLIENPIRFAAPVRNSAGASLTLGAAVTAVAVSVGLLLLVVVPVPVGRGAPAPTLVVTGETLTGKLDAARYDAAVNRVFAQVESSVAKSVDVRAVPSNLDPSLGEAETDKGATYLDGCLRSYLQVGQPECATGAVGSSTTVALVGDSHAAMWDPAFQFAAEQQHWRLDSLSRVACPILDLPIRSPYLRRDYTECERWRGEIVARLQVQHPRLIVVGVSRDYTAGFGFTSYEPEWVNSLTRMVTTLRSTGAKVLVLGPIPKPLPAVPVCLSEHLDDATACVASTSEAVNEAGMLAEAAAVKAGGGEYADVTRLFCTADRCPVIVGNTLVYRDSNHMSLEYARVLGPVMSALADRTLARQ